jgi:hypothetical protein
MTKWFDLTFLVTNHFFDVENDVVQISASVMDLSPVRFDRMLQNKNSNTKKVDRMLDQSVDLQSR